MNEAMGRIERSARLLGAAAAIGVLLATAGCQSERHVPMIQAPAACEPFAVSIYFEANAADINSPAAAVLRSAVKRANSCFISRVRVVGLADAAGPTDANLRLSDRRANAVTQALTEMGVTLGVIEVVGAGDAGARDRLGEARPVRRRVDVTFNVATRPVSR